MTRYLAIVLSVVLCTTAFAQENPLLSFSVPQKDTTKASLQAEQLNAPNSPLLLEDIFGRLYNGAMLSENYQYTFHKSNYTRTDGQKYSHQDDFHILSLSGGYGRRDKYQVNSSLNMSGDDLAGRNSYRDVDLNFIYLPGNAWQVFNRFATNSNDQSSIKDNFDWNGSLLYLSHGQIDMVAQKFPHYFFFRDILLNRRQLLISFDPTYSYHKNDWNDHSYHSKAAQLPITFLYGLSDMINLKLNFGFQTDEYRDEHSIFSSDPSSSEKIGTGTNEHHLENLSSNVGFYLIPDPRFLLEGSADFDHRKDTYRYRDLYVNGFSQYYKSVNMRDSYAIHLRANYLSIHRALSVVDFRRSYYNGSYLKQSELKNQFHLNFYSQNYDEQDQWRLSDEFGFGITDHINLSLNGDYARAKENYLPQNDEGSWRYSSGLIFYNLNFAGDELNDFDYFYGRIVQPNDYIGTIRWSQSHDVYFYEADWKSLQLEFQTGLLKNMDVQLNYSYGTDKFEGGKGSSHDFGAGLRMNLLNNFRVMLSAAHGKHHYKEASSSAYSTSDSYFWFWKLAAQASF